MCDLVERLRFKGQADRERLNHTWRRLHTERLEAAREIERLRAEIGRFHDERSYIVGWNDGFDYAHAQDQ